MGTSSKRKIKRIVVKKKGGGVYTENEFPRGQLLAESEKAATDAGLGRQARFDRGG